MKLTAEQMHKYFEARLGRTLPFGRNIAVRCPFHEDKSPSLSLDASRGVWVCHAGCGQGGVLEFEKKFSNCDDQVAFANVNEVCGLPNTALFRGKPEVVYSYTDEDGNVLFEAVKRLSVRCFAALRESLARETEFLEEQLLAGLQEKVLHPDVVEYTLQRFEEELRRATDRRGDEAAMHRRQEAAIEKKISNLTRALADGYSPAITAALSQLEEQLGEIRERAAASRPEALQIRMRDTRRFVESRLSDLRSLFDAEAVTIRAEIAKHVQKIILSPEGRSYVAAGTWDLLGVAAWMVPGAWLAPW
jgi:hypothetical protein